uniref:Predicted protein n=1 Tax=Physcomitrium patens TaxID=3218 RepID=A9U5K3_PHYPA
MKLCNKAHEADLETRDPYPVMEELELQPRKTTLLLCPSTYFGDISCPFGKAHSCKLLAEGGGHRGLLKIHGSPSPDIDGIVRSCALPATLTMSGSMERVRRLLLAELKLTIPDLTSMWVSDLQVKKTEPDTGSCGSCQAWCQTELRCFFQDLNSTLKRFRTTCFRFLTLWSEIQTDKQGNYRNISISSFLLTVCFSDSKAPKVIQTPEYSSPQKSRKTQGWKKAKKCYAI